MQPLSGISHIRAIYIIVFEVWTLLLGLIVIAVSKHNIISGFINRAVILIVIGNKSDATVKLDGIAFMFLCKRLYILVIRIFQL